MTEMGFESESVGSSTPPIQDHLNQAITGIPQSIQRKPCFCCQQQGHWVKDCPNKPPHKRRKPASAGPSVGVTGSDFTEVQCPCGGGTCVIITSKTVKNPGRKYYKCPGKAGGGCGYFRWCDAVTDDETSDSPHAPYPMCSCGAGVCTILTARTVRNAGRKFFVCPVPKGQGACKFFQWQDTPAKTAVNGHEDESSPESSPRSTLNIHQDTNPANGDFGKEGVLSLERMEFESPVMDTPQHCPNPLAVSDMSSPKHCNQSRDGAPENNRSVPDSTTDLMLMPQAKFGDSMMEKTLQASVLTSQAEAHCRQAEFSRQISIATTLSGAFATSYSCSSALPTVLVPLRQKFFVTDPIHHMLGLHAQSWWGRLAFPPPRCLTVPAPKPFFCCIFPSFDPIFVPRDVDVLDVEASTIPLQNELSLLTPDQAAQHLSVVLREPSGLKSPLDIVQGNIITSSILEAFGQAALHVQNELLTVLESMDLRDHKSMVQEANSAFAALECLSVDYRPFYERVKEFICHASSLATIEWSIRNDLSSQELVNRYNREKLQFDDISHVYDEAVAAFTASNEHLELLHEEASRVKDMLLLIESELSSCEAETMDLETCLVQISKDKLESKRSMQAASREAAKALRVCQQREVEQSAAKAAFEKAKVELRQ